MQQLNEILEPLKDYQWHYLEEINRNISLLENKVNKLLIFLKEQGFIEIKNEKIRITDMGSQFLELPF